MLKISLSLIFAFSFLAFSSATTNAQIPRIKFKRGAASASITGKILGRSQKSYVVGAKAGQIIKALISSDGNKVRFVSGMGQGNLELSDRTVDGDNYIFLKNNSSKPVAFKMIITIK